MSGMVSGLVIIVVDSDAGDAGSNPSNDSWFFKEFFYELVTPNIVSIILYIHIYIYGGSHAHGSHIDNYIYIYNIYRLYGYTVAYIFADA